MSICYSLFEQDQKAIVKGDMRLRTKLRIYGLFETETYYIKTLTNCTEKTINSNCSLNNNMRLVYPISHCSN
jgi:hypothetical protein